MQGLQNTGEHGPDTPVAKRRPEKRRSASRRELRFFRRGEELPSREPEEASECRLGSEGLVSKVGSVLASIFGCCGSAG